MVPYGVGWPTFEVTSKATKSDLKWPEVSQSD